MLVILEHRRWDRQAVGLTSVLESGGGVGEGGAAGKKSGREECRAGSALRMLVALAEDLSCVPSAGLGWPTSVSNSVGFWGIPCPALAPQALSAHMHGLRQTHTHRHK